MSTAVFTPTPTEQIQLHTAKPSFIGTVRGEFFKIARQWTNWIMLVLLLGVIVLPFIVEMTAPNAKTNIQTNPLHFYYNILSITLSILRVFTGIFLLILTARTIGLEYQLGTIRILLARGLGRLQLLFAKLLAVTLIALGLLVFGLILNYLLTVLLVIGLTGNLDSFNALNSVFWSDARIYVLSIMLNMQRAEGVPCIPSPSQLCKRWQAAGAPPFETLFVLTVGRAVRCRLIRARDLIMDSAPILAWRRKDPDATLGHAPAHHPRPLLRGYRVHTLLCRGSGLPVHLLLWPAHAHDAPCARPFLEWAVHFYHLHPRFIRLDAGYWGLQLIHWIHARLGAVAVVPWNPKSQKNRSCLPPTWTKEELGKRTSIERFFGLQRPPFSGWSAIVRQVALTYTASLIVAFAAWHADRPDLIRSPKRVLAHLWEDSEL